MQVPKVLQPFPRITIPVQSCSSFDSIGRQSPKVVKVKKATLHHWRHLSWTICLLSCIKCINTPQNQKRGWTQTATLLPAHIRDRKNYKTSRLEAIGNQALSPTLIANYRNLFNSFQFQTLELISQSPQPSQNPAKDPRRTPEHGTSIVLRQRPWDLDLSTWIGEAFVHINPTCGVEAELGIQIPTVTVLVWKYWKNRTAQRATLHS